MADYNRVNPFSPLGGNPNDVGGQPTGPLHGMAPAQGGYYQSPQPYSQPWEPYHGDLGSPEFEMHEAPRPGIQNKKQSQQSMNSEYSTSSTIFPSKSSPNPNDVESQSFLDPMHRMDTTFNAKDVPYKDPHAKQFRHILLGMSTRWFVTAGLCAAFIVSTLQWKKRGAQSEDQKKLFNAVTTGISICLGLNIASAFKDIALNMRWVILAQKKRPLKEVDLILSIDSMLRVAKLVMISGKPWVILAGSAWLFINILAQAGIAMLSLTYSWDPATDGVIMRSGNVTIPKLDYFYPLSDDKPGNITAQDEAYTAHLYGGLISYYGVNASEIKPVPGQIAPQSANMLYLWPKEKRISLPFVDSPSSQDVSYSDYSVMTDREISVTYNCHSYVVTAGGNGTENNITVKELGEIYVSHKAPNSTTYFTDKPTGAAPNQCGDDPRCSVVQAFEASATEPWYYTCNITVAKTINDNLNLTWVSDRMASIAGSAIAQVGYTDEGQEAQVYPQGSIWGAPSIGDEDDMGQYMAIYALGSLASATILNPVTTYPGKAPSQGTSLKIGHRISFLMILGLICGCHLLFIIVVAILANKAKIGPSSHLEMSLLLRPIADQLEGVRSNGKANDAYNKVLQSTQAKYERSVNERWILKTS